MLPGTANWLRCLYSFFFSFGGAWSKVYGFCMVLMVLDVQNGYLAVFLVSVIICYPIFSDISLLKNKKRGGGVLTCGAPKKMKKLTGVTCARRREEGEGHDSDMLCPRSRSGSSCCSSLEAPPFNSEVSVPNPPAVVEIEMETKTRISPISGHRENQINR